MKRYIVTLVIVLLWELVWAQDQPSKYSLEFPKDNLFELNTGAVYNQVVRFNPTNEKGSANNGWGFTIGLTYSRKVFDRFWLGGGYNFMSIKNEWVRPRSLEKDVDDKPCAGIKTTNMWSIPMHLRYELLKWLYIKPIMSFDFQGQNKEGNFISNQTGMSVWMAAGVSLRLGKWCILQLEPKVGITALAPFRHQKYQQRFVCYATTAQFCVIF